MKNYIVLALLTLGLSSAAFAQDAKKADKKMEKKEHAAKAKKTDPKVHAGHESTKAK